MPQLMTDPTVMAKIDHFGFHNYAGDSGGADAAIKRLAYPTKDFWITEVTNIWDIFTHLPEGPTSTLVWDAYGSVYNHAILAGRGSNPPNDAGNGAALLAYNSNSGVYTPRRGFYECAQLFKFVGPGAQRIRASSSSSSLTVFAFRDQSRGRLTLVGGIPPAAPAPNGTLVNVPSVSQFVFYETTSSSSMPRRPDVAVSNRSFSVQVSGNSVFTLTVTTAPDSSGPTVSMSDPIGATVSGTVTIGASATDNVGVAGVQFLLDGNLLGQEDTSAPYEVQCNTLPVAAGSHQLAARARDGAGNTAVSSTIVVTVDNTDTTAPTVAITAPANGSTVQER
jgi:hypothetical protein